MHDKDDFYVELVHLRRRRATPAAKVKVEDLFLPTVHDQDIEDSEAILAPTPPQETKEHYKGTTVKTLRDKRILQQEHDPTEVPSEGRQKRA